MHGKDPPESVEPLKIFIPPGAFDMYVIGTEECCRDITEAMLISSDKALWEERLTELFGDEYVQLKAVTLTAIHLIIFVRASHVHLYSEIQFGSVACGLGNYFGNKGGVAISGRFCDSTFIFVNSHLAAHDANVQERNDGFLRINTELKSILDCPPPPRKSPYPQYATSCFDVAFWLGDLNYRINGTRAMVDELLGMWDEMHDVLVANDQLGTEMGKGNVFQGFEEAGPLSFKPTYKFDTGTDVYDTSAKARTPAWTDRILHRSSSQIEALQVRLLLANVF